MFFLRNWLIKWARSLVVEHFYGIEKVGGSSPPGSTDESRVRRTSDRLRGSLFRSKH